VSTDDLQGPSPATTFSSRLRVVVGPLLVLAVFLAALWMLHLELRQYTLREFLEALEGVPVSRVALSVLLTLINYAILVCYDWVGVRYIRHPMALHRIALASFLGYAVGNNFGTLMGGSAIRYRLYSSWGLSAFEIVKLIFIVGLSYWVGLFALAGVLFVFDPLPIPDRLHLPISDTRPMGVAVGSLAVGYLVLCAMRRRPLVIRDLEFSPPPVGLSLTQYAIASLDLVVAAGALYVLLPASLEVSFLHFLGIYLLAIVAGVVSQVPGGLGVLELVVLVLLNPIEAQPVVGALLAFRFIYYLLPLALGLFLLGGREAAQHGWLVRHAVDFVGGWAPMIAPRLLSIGGFLAGATLIFSASTPSAESRLEAIGGVLPLWVIEGSHFLGGIVGVLLLLLSRSLQRRIGTAYAMTVVLLAAGIVLSLTKGLDYEEAVLLAAILVVLVPCRSDFYRSGSLWTERFTLPWITAVAIVLGACLALMLFAYKQIDYSNALWWQFTLDDSVSRSLRAWAGIGATLLLLAARRGLWATHLAPDLPTPSDLEVVAGLVAGSPRASARLALLGDKRFLFDSQKSGFLMYGVAGDCFVALGDAVADESTAAELAWRFRELCEAGNAWPVFYEVDEARLGLYIDMGLSPMTLGEEARVRLADFRLEGNDRPRLQQTNQRLLDAGCRFQVVPADEVAPLLPVLRELSDNWLLAKNTKEKGFSLGYFDPHYVQRFPVALVLDADLPVAFANLWCGADREEISVDLLRYHVDAPGGAMDFLLVQAMLWARMSNYRWFNLGMAPLPGTHGELPASPWWNRVAALTHQHGENFYNLQGLRHFKENFQPIWSQKYLAAPADAALPMVLANVARLIGNSPRRDAPPIQSC